MKSNRQLKDGARRTNGYRPRLENLEHRWCPSCLMFDDKVGTLFIIGDDMDNDIVLADHRGTIQVTCDGESKEFTGIRSIILRSAGGNDGVSYIQDDLSDPAIMPMSLDIDLGDGNNVARAHIGDIIDAPLSYRLVSGAGRDNVQLTHAGGIGGSGQFLVEISTGFGNDQVNILAPAPSVPSDLVPGPLARFDGHFDLGAGDDRFIDGWGMPADVPHTVVVIGGRGNDVVLEHWADLRAPVSLTYDLGQGNDMLSCRIDRVEAALSVIARGGLGADGILLSLGFHSEPEPPPEFPVFFPVFVEADCGEGSDAARLSLDLAGRRDVRLQAAIRGGGGDDLLALDVAGLEFPVFVEALLEGGKGHDIARVTRSVLADALFRDIEEILLID